MPIPRHAIRKQPKFRKGETVAYKDVYGDYTQSGKITRTYMQDGFKHYVVGGASYLADEIKKIIKTDAAKAEKWHSMGFHQRIDFLKGYKISMKQKIAASEYSELPKSVKNKL
jgi:hypothetical protein